MNTQSNLIANKADNNNLDSKVSYRTWLENNKEFPDLVAKKTAEDGWELFDQKDQDNWSEINVSDIHSYATIAKINVEKKAEKAKPTKKVVRSIQPPQYQRKDEIERDDTYDVDNYDSTTIFYSRKELGRVASIAADVRKKNEEKEFEYLHSRPVKCCKVCMHD